MSKLACAVQDVQEDREGRGKTLVTVSAFTSTANRDTYSARAPANVTAFSEDAPTSSKPSTTEQKNVNACMFMLVLPLTKARQGGQSTADHAAGSQRRVAVGGGRLEPLTQILPPPPPAAERARHRLAGDQRPAKRDLGLAERGQRLAQRDRHGLAEEGQTPVERDHHRLAEESQRLAERDRHRLAEESQTPAERDRHRPAEESQRPAQRDLGLAEGQRLAERGQGMTV